MFELPKLAANETLQDNIGELERLVSLNKNESVVMAKGTRCQVEPTMVFLVAELADSLGDFFRVVSTQRAGVNTNTHDLFCW